MVRPLPGRLHTDGAARGSVSNDQLYNDILGNASTRPDLITIPSWIWGVTRYYNNATQPDRDGAKTLIYAWSALKSRITSRPNYQRQQTLAQVSPNKSNATSCEPPRHFSHILCRTGDPTKGDSAHRLSSRLPSSHRSSLTLPTTFRPS